MRTRDNRRQKRPRTDNIVHADFRLCEKMADGTARYVVGDTFIAYKLLSPPASGVRPYKARNPAAHAYYEVDHQDIFDFLHEGARGRKILTKEPSHEPHGQPSYSDFSGPPYEVRSLSDLRVANLHF